jgi:DNA-binding NarL/FixJ family response regulator
MLQVLQEVYEGGAPMDPTLASRINAFLQQHEAHHVLQPRQLQVLNLLAEGQNFRLTADQLGISYYAVHKHVRAIYDALHQWHAAHA